MGHVSVVYGNIIGVTWKSEDYHKLQRLNKRVIDSLPVNDTAFPWVERSMFLAPDPDNNKVYREQIIVFGASYKEVEKEWEQWLEKFEVILRQLYWTSATIHLSTELVGSHTYQWVFDMNQLDNWISDKPNPTTIWEFSGGPRRFFENGIQIPQA